MRFKSMLTNALGIGQECKVSTFVVPVADGDRFLLCSDGVTEYVQRAQALASADRMQPGLPSPGADGVLPPELMKAKAATAGVSVPTSLTAGLPQAPGTTVPRGTGVRSGMAGLPSFGDVKTPKLGEQDDDISPQDALLAALAGGVPLAAAAVTLAQLRNAAKSGIALSPSDAARLSSATRPQDLAGGLADLPSLEDLGDEALDPNTLSLTAPRLHTATFDAWHEMGQALDGARDVSVDAGADIDPAALQQLLGGAPAAASSDVTTPRLDLAAAQLAHRLNEASAMAQPQAEVGALRVDPRVLDRGARMDEARLDPSDLMPVSTRHALTGAADLPSTARLTPSTLLAKDDAAAALGALGVAVAAPAESGRESAGDSGTGGEPSGRDARPENGPEPLHAPSAHNLTSHLHFGGEGTSGFAATLEGPTDGAVSAGERAALMRQVLDRATMLRREGGGTTRLELNQGHLGNLQLAINLDRDRLDMRVITGSDRAREAILSDLNGLRNALSVQNVRLGNVDVGVGQNGGGFQGSASGGGFAQHQQPQRDGLPRRPDLADLVRAPDVARVSNLRSALSPSVPLNIAGKIAVRA
jgi:flagellar hook-length control protein FliK